MSWFPVAFLTNGAFNVTRFEFTTPMLRACVMSVGTVEEIRGIGEREGQEGINMVNF